MATQYYLTKEKWGFRVKSLTAGHSSNCEFLHNDDDPEDAILNLSYSDDVKMQLLEDYHRKKDKPLKPEFDIDPSKIDPEAIEKILRTMQPEQGQRFIDWLNSKRKK